MVFADPFFFVGEGEVGEEFVAFGGRGGDVEDSSEGIADFDPEHVKGHVGEADAVFWVHGRCWGYVGVVDVERLYLVSIVQDGMIEDLPFWYRIVLHQS